MIPLAWRKGSVTGGIRSVEIGGYLKTKVIPLAIATLP
jgi:hypothetical protein